MITAYYQYYDATDNGGINAIQFADGTSWNRDQIKAITSGNPIPAGPSGTTLDAPNGTAMLQAGADDNTFNGGIGDDTFIYNASSGNLTINDHASPSMPVRSNMLQFNNLNASDLTFMQNGGDLLIGVNATGKSVLVAGEFNSVDRDGVQAIGFADGTHWTRADIAAHAHGGT